MVKNNISGGTKLCTKIYIKFYMVIYLIMSDNIYIINYVN